MTDEQDISPPAASNAGPPWKLLALLLLTIAVAVFFAQNGSDTQVDFLWMNGKWPVWAVIGVSLLAGILLDRLVGWQWRRARRRKDEAQGR